MAIQTNFRLEAKNLFLTYPQCSLLKEDVLSKIKTFFSSLVFAVVAHELHEDGSPHLHCLISLSARYRTRDASALDVFTGQHGNYQSARNVFKVMQYVTKGKDYISHGVDVQTYLNARESKTNSKLAIAVEMINEGKSLEEIDKEIPTCVLSNKRKIEEYIAWKVSKKMKNSLVPWILPVTNQILRGTLALHPSQKICKWLAKNIRQERPLGTKQLYIHGKTALGKTHLIQQLSKMLHIYHVPRTEKFFDMYEDGEYDLCVLDEFRGNKEITFMNSFLDGQHVTLPRKGSQVLSFDVHMNLMFNLGLKNS